MTLCVALAPACGEDAAPGNFPTCADNEVAITGDLDGAPYEFRMTWEGYSFVNAGIGGADGHFDVTFDSGAARIVFDFRDVLANGGEVMALAQLNAGGVNVGNCPDEPFWSILTRGPDGDGTFTLSNLRPYMYCEEAELEGTLHGCYGKSAP